MNYALNRASLKHQVCQALIALFSLFLSREGHTDAMAYAGGVDITATAGQFTVRHVHDWDHKKLDDNFYFFLEGDNIFSCKNDLAFVELRDEKGLVIFKTPSPALTTIWMSPDTDYIVGLSKIWDSNPYQLVVWRRDGTLLLKRNLALDVIRFSMEDKKKFAKRFLKAARMIERNYYVFDGEIYNDSQLLNVKALMGETVVDYLKPFQSGLPFAQDRQYTASNFVYWFDEANPDISISTVNRETILSLRSITGKKISIPIGQETSPQTLKTANAFGQQCPKFASAH